MKSFSLNNQFSQRCNWWPQYAFRWSLQLWSSCCEATLLKNQVWSSLSILFIQFLWTPRTQGDFN